MLLKRRKTEALPSCPICGSTQLEPFRKPPQRKCAGCASLDRHRLLWLYLQRFGLLAGSPLTLHIAPELKISDALQKRLGAAYLPVDLNPRKGMFVSSCDLCSDLAEWPSGAFDLVFHNHVLEHLICDPFDVLRQLRRCMRFGGLMLFSIPISEGHYRENTSPELSNDERVKLFGQANHYRRFGVEDVLGQLNGCLGNTIRWNARETFAEDALAQAGIGLDLNIDRNTIIIFRKLSA